MIPERYRESMMFNLNIAPFAWFAKVLRRRNQIQFIIENLGTRFQKMSKGTTSWAGSGVMYTGSTVVVVTNVGNGGSGQG